ncbi:transposase, partial [Staphylococcus warneri]
MCHLLLHLYDNTHMTLFKPILNAIIKVYRRFHMIVKTRTNVYDFNFHLVWVTKYRASIFDTDLKRNEMKRILENISHRYDITI